MKQAQQTLSEHYKLPPKLVELFKAMEDSSIVGFGQTQEIQDYFLLTAILKNQSCNFCEELMQELSVYSLNLLINLSNTHHCEKHE